jgi:alpha-beta hydrolase superfamily lysophospholipase
VDITGSSAFVSYDSILLEHDAPVRRAYLLLHGLTASPPQFEAFGRILFDRGANVLIPRLPHHGYGDRLTPALQDLTADELRAFATANVALANGLGREVVVVGFSLGGTLAAWIGQRFPVLRATAIAPFLGIAGLPHPLTRPLARFALRVPNRYFWWDPVRREELQPAHGYPRVPTHALARAAELGHELLSDAERWRPAARDVQVVVNAREAAVSNASATELARAWSRTTGQRIVLHRLRGLPISHDIIEPSRNPQIVRRIYPALVELVAR